METQDAEVPIGSVNVYLQSLAYMVELDEQLPITDFTGQERGQLSVSLAPCTPQGKEITGEFVDSPRDLVNIELMLEMLLNENVFYCINLLCSPFYRLARISTSR